MPVKEKKWIAYPRPQLKRNKYVSLNGEWQLDGTAINVPFAPQSVLSGYQGNVEEHLVYKTTFSIPKDFDLDRILLHFGAVDQITEVKINDISVGRNEGGYLPFSFDITEVIKRNEENAIELRVTDDLSRDYPYGKQAKKPSGMWYTPVSGIWQSVWLENVPKTYIERLVMKPDLEKLHLAIVCNEPAEAYKVEIDLPDGDVLEVDLDSTEADITIPKPIHWTPETPHLYNMRITAGCDKVESYFALRTIDIQEIDGVKRVCLNDNPIFFHGVLDQGYFKDGIYLPEREEEYERDILRMKELGFNMLRKHIKIEPEYFYYVCDKLGMLVMQDMINNGSYSYIRDTVLPTIGFKKRDDKRLNKSERGRQIFRKQTKKTIEHLYNHPCVVAYTIFNEGWGQFNSDEMYDYAKELDGTRLVDSTSGWYAQKKNDFDSEHIYFRLKKLKVKERPLFVTECGGYQYLVKEHFFGKKEYGYGACKDSHELTERICKMYEKMILPYIKDGVCGCIYTQLSDVEGEINGLYTYDRKICKVDKERIREISRRIEEEL